MNDVINNASFWDAYSVTRSPGDGHCLLHSVAASCNSLTRLSSSITTEQLMYMVRDEVIEHAELYLQFLVDSCHNDLVYHMNQYVFNKIYDTDFGNLVPLVLANALHVNIGIISEGVQGYNARVIHANACNNTLGNILVYKTPDHYDSIILKPAAAGNTSQGCDRYKRIGGSPIGRHSVSVGDPLSSSGKYRFSDGSLIPDSPNTSGGKSMTHGNTPFTMISPDRATNTKRPHRNGIGYKL